MIFGGGRSDLDVGLNTLEKYTVEHAMHSKPPEPMGLNLQQELHRRTRQDVLNFISNWIECPEPQHGVLWLHAPVGHGKTTIMKEIVETLPHSNHAGNFFFSRGKTRPSTARYLIPSIAIQIAGNIPAVRGYINQVMIDDPKLPLRDIHTQLQRLILDPFRYSPPLSNKPVVIIDGLDECSRICDTDELSTDKGIRRFAALDAQSFVLDIIVKAVSSPHCPLRFLIASRPESHLKQAFLEPRLFRISKQIELDVVHPEKSPDYIVSFPSDPGMGQYLRDGLNAIHNKQKLSDEDIWDLIEMASGQFLFAKSVLEFFRTGSRGPHTSLRMIKERHTKCRATFSNMDTLYTEILTICPGRKRHLKRILGICAYLHRWKHLTLTIATLTEILGTLDEDVEMTFRGLYALFDIDEYDSEDKDDNTSPLRRHHSPRVCVRHNSFVDFLLDEDRSRKFHVDVNAMRGWLMSRADSLIEDGLRRRTPRLLHKATLELIIHLASGAFTKDNDTHFIRFPYFLQFLQEIKQARFAIPDNPGTRFVESLYIALDILVNANGFCWIRCHEEFKDSGHTCQNLLDETWKKILIPSSPNLSYFQAIVHTIVMHISPDISVVSQELKTTHRDTLHILDSFSYFLIQDHRVQLLPIFSQFAENELRSGILHAIYRNCWIHVILAQFSELLKKGLNPESDRSVLAFNLVERFYNKPILSDINYISDFPGNATTSTMIDLIDFVPTFVNRCLSILGKDEFDYGNGLICLLIRWLNRQHKNLESEFAQRKYNSIVTKLQAIINKINWDGLIFHVFTFPTPDSSGFPFNIRINHSLIRAAEAMKTYSSLMRLARSKTDPPFNGDVISSTSHTEISEFFLQALFPCEVKGESDVTWKESIIINDVDWHDHLRHAESTQKISAAILTVSHILNNQDSTASLPTLDVINRVAKTRKFADGVDAWLEIHKSEVDSTPWRWKGMEEAKSPSPDGILKPSMDLHEDAETRLVTATFELPGISKLEDIDVTVHKGKLIISAETKRQNLNEASYTVRERRYGKYSRNLYLPQGVKKEDIKASLEGGILTMTFPKSTF